jgi:hypothetical protein
MRRIVAISCIILGLGALGAPASAASALDLALHIRGTATLSADGSVVLVRIAYRCSEAVATTDLSMYVFERVGGNRMSVGYGSIPFEDLVCDGERHSAVVAVEAFDRPFRKGSGLARGEFYATNADFSVSDVIRTSREIDIVRR